MEERLRDYFRQKQIEENTLQGVIRGYYIEALEKCVLAQSLMLNQEAGKI